MKDSIIVDVDGHGKFILKSGSKISELLKQIDDNKYIIAAEIDHEIVELSQTLTADTKLRLVSCNERIGGKIYQSGLKYLYITAVNELYGIGSNVEIKHSLDKGIYTEIKVNRTVTEEIVKEIKDKMKELVERDLQIQKISASRRSAIKYFEEIKEPEKVKIYKQMTSENVTLYQLLNYYNYFYCQMPESTGILKKFELTFLPPRGVVLTFPIDFNKPIPKFTMIEPVMEEFKSYETWAERVGVRYACDINEMLIHGGIDDFIKLNELKHQREIEHIASEIAKNKKIRMILIGGPSSSGKTTTSKKLSLCLKERGINPFILSTDNYMRERKNQIKDKNGEYEFDLLESLDLKLLNDNISDLLLGKEVKLPKYSFELGEKEFKSAPVKLEENSMIIIEGLHTLNEKLTSSIDRNLKYKIYISPFTPLNLDRHNHVSTVDVRLLRRIIRDYRTRTFTADYSFDLWRNVRDSEDAYVFPYQNEADIVLNTAILHEIGMLEVYVLPLLYSIKEDSVNYPEAKRMINFLKCFFAIPNEKLPDTSLLREFIGNSYFE